MGDQLQKRIDEEYDLFIAQVQERRRFSGDTQWLFHSPSLIPFKPDYFELGSFGRSKLERFLNQTLSRGFPELWPTLAWPRIGNAILTHVTGKYIPEIWLSLEASEHHNQLKKRFSDTLNQVLLHAHTAIRHATFSELYLFINTALKALSTSLGTPHDIFHLHKAHHNDYCLTILKEVRQDILEHPNAFELAVYLSIRANWIDCVEDTIDPFLHSYLEEINALLDHPDELNTHKYQNPYFQLHAFHACLQKKNMCILFETDNSGEIVMDLLVIEMLLIQGHTVKIASKKSPVLNDVTTEDVDMLLKNSYFDYLKPYLERGQLALLHTNSEVSGKYLPRPSKAYQEAYKNADLLILKGQGNFQTMPMGQKVLGKFIPYPYKKPIVYLMGVKAPFIQQCFSTVLSKGPLPERHSPFLYLFDSKKKLTYPK